MYDCIKQILLWLTNNVSSWLTAMNKYEIYYQIKIENVNLIRYKKILKFSYSLKTDVTLKLMVGAP